MRWPPHPNAPLLLLLAALALLWFATAGVRSLTEPDEGRYAEIPREMVASGNWAVPHLDGIQYLEKPPLQYWGTAVFYTLFGVHGWVSRLWTTGLGFACVVLVGLGGRRLYGSEAGLDAALVLASLPLFFGLGQINTLDMGLTFFLTAALLALLEGVRAAPASERERYALWLAWLALGLAMLQKGLVALVLPGFAVALYSLLARDRQLWRRLHLASGLVLALAVNLPWWLYMARYNPAFPEFFFVHEHFTRFTTTEHARQQPWWYLGMVLIAGLLPWIGPVARGVLTGWQAPAARSPQAAPGATLAPQGVRPAATQVATQAFNATRFLAAWAAAVFIFYAPSGSKLAPYILPMMPPLALLAGRELASRGVRALRPVLILAALLALGMLVARPIAAQLLALGPKRDLFLAAGRWVGTGGALLAAATALAAWLARRGNARPVVVTLALGLVASFAVLTCGTNSFERWRGGPYLAARVAPWLEPSTPLYCVGLYPQTLIFALRRTCVTVGYHGELEIQFDRDGRHFIADTARFLAEWERAPRAVAIIEPSVWPGLQARSIPATIVAREPTAYVIVKSPPRKPTEPT